MFQRTLNNIQFRSFQHISTYDQYHLLDACHTSLVFRQHACLIAALKNAEQPSVFPAQTVSHILWRVLAIVQLSGICRKQAPSFVVGYSSPSCLKPFSHKLVTFQVYPKNTLNRKKSNFFQSISFYCITVEHLENHAFQHWKILLLYFWQSNSDKHSHSEEILLIKIEILHYKFWDRIQLLVYYLIISPERNFKEVALDYCNKKPYVWTKDHWNIAYKINMH